MATDPRPVNFELERIGKRGNLVTSLAQLLEKQILSGALQPGDQLPTEAVIAREAGVSRTVVREAVASLRAAGLVETRQGAGAFVLPSATQTPMFPRIDRNEVEGILSVLELRLALETEAAALAARRRTDEDIAIIDGTLADLEEARLRGEQGVEADLAFHVAIATATRNPHFAPLLESLGEAAMPRRRLSRKDREAVNMTEYLALVVADHRAIRNAIVVGDAALSAATMRSHLGGSQKRYADLLAR